MHSVSRVRYQQLRMYLQIAQNLFAVERYSMNIERDLSGPKSCLYGLPSDLRNCPLQNWHYHLTRVRRLRNKSNAKMSRKIQLKLPMACRIPRIKGVKLGLIHNSQNRAFHFECSDQRVLETLTCRRYSTAVPPNGVTPAAAFIRMLSTT